MVHELKHSGNTQETQKTTLYYISHFPAFLELIHIVCCSRATPAALYVAHLQYVRQ